MNMKYALGAVTIFGCMALSLFFWPFEPVLAQIGVEFQLERLIFGAIVGAALLHNILVVLSTLEKKQKEAAHQAASLKRRQGRIINAEPAAWVTPEDDLSRVFDKLDALNAMPHLLKKLRAYWGFPEFLEFTDALLTMETGRETRRGFDPLVHQEVTALRDFYIENIDRIMSPDLTSDQRDRIFRFTRRAA